MFVVWIVLSFLSSSMCLCHWLPTVFGKNTIKVYNIKNSLGHSCPEKISDQNSPNNHMLVYKLTDPLIYHLMYIYTYLSIYICMYDYPAPQTRWFNNWAKSKIHSLRLFHNHQDMWIDYLDWFFLTSEILVFKKHSLCKIEEYFAIIYTIKINYSR